MKRNYEIAYRSKIFSATVFFLSAFLFSLYSDLSAAETAAIKPGDKVGIQFTCRFPNGEIAASTSTAVAQDSSLRKSTVFLPRSKDDPIEVTVGQNVGAKKFPFPFLDEIVDRISASLAGTALGVTRTIEIRSERPAGVPEKDQFLQLVRTRHYAKEIKMTKDEFKSRTGKDPVVGVDYRDDPLIPCKVASVSENEVVIRPSVQPGSQVDTPFGKATIRENGNQLDLVIDAPKGSLVRMGAIVGRISDVQDKMFTMDFGDAFGGEPLSCEVKAESLPEKKMSK